MIFSGILLEAVDKAIMWISRIVIALAILLALMSFLYIFLPDDPLQAYIAEFTSVVQPYTALLNYFLPVPYMGFALSFFIAFKYIIKPIRMLFRNVFNMDLDLSGNGDGFYDWH